MRGDSLAADFLWQRTLTDATSISGGIGIGSQGQVALTAQIDNGRDVVLLLTPKNPVGASQTP